MAEVRRTDPAARRQAAWIVVAGTCAGALLIAAFERYRAPLSDWVLADPGPRARLVFAFLALLALAPMIALAGYLWLLGASVVRAREYPPPRMRVVRDTVILTGERAASRGRLLKAFALGCVAVGAVLGVLLFRLAFLLSP